MRRNHPALTAAGYLAAIPLLIIGAIVATAIATVRR